MAHGLSEYSAVGLGFMALTFALLQDFSEGYRLGKLARSLNKSSKVIPKLQVDVTVLSVVNVWKEPIQSVLPPLLDTPVCLGPPSTQWPTLLPCVPSSQERAWWEKR